MVFYIHSLYVSSLMLIYINRKGLNRFPTLFIHDLIPSPFDTSIGHIETDC